MVRLLIFLILAAPVIVCAQAPFTHTNTYVDVPGSEPREHPVDMVRMSLDVRFEPEKGLVKGTVTNVFKVLQDRTDSIVFDAIKIRVLQATLGGRPVRFRNTDTTVVVYCEPSLRWDSQDSVTFIYEANPRKGIYFIGWNDPSKRMRKQIWTQGQAVDNRYWMPMYDEMNDKMITETSTTFDSNYVVVSNGTRTSTIMNSDGTKTWRYTMAKPHASYLLMIAIGDYSVTRRASSSGVPLLLYGYPEHPEKVEPTYRMSVEAMDFLEREIGIPYPWESYSQVPVADFVFGAMENTTATIFGDFFVTDSRGWLDRSYVGVNVHELTHQWFGNFVTGRSIKSVWLQESFATYYPHLFTRLTQGEDAYEWSRRGMQNSALSAGEKDRLPIVHPSSGTARIYPKGACVIDMMRSTFGDSAVRRVIKHYALRHAYGNVETNDLYLSFQDTLGISPDWFFDEWLYKGGEPHFKISTRVGASTTERGMSTSTLVDIEQIHNIDELTGVFRMPVNIEVYYTDKSKDCVRVTIRDQRTLIDIPNPSGKTPSFVIFDPGSQILKRVTYDRTWESRLAQLHGAQHMIDRFDAFEWFRGDTSRVQDRLDMLDDVMNKERFHAMRSEAVGQGIELGQRGITHAWKTVERGLIDAAVEVRTASIAGLSVIPEQLKGACERLLEDSSYAIIQVAFSKLVRTFPSDRKTYISKVRGVRGPHERVRIVRLEAEASDGNAAAVSELADLCGPGWEFITRQNAIAVFKRLGTLTEDATRNILDAIWSTNSRLSGSTLGVVTSLVDQPKLREVVRKVSNETQLLPWQRDMILSMIR